ncbi:hypothetical protein, partial [Streptosporangium saharense]|uniref:hypothetical protein n=1 Tax=Streptosporangium saharense TaxID=1706840 RepID=UPI00332E2108
ARREEATLRSCVRTRGLGRVHLAPRVRLAVGRSANPLTGRLRELGLDGARPLLCLSTITRRTLQEECVPVRTV